MNLKNHIRLNSKYKYKYKHKKIKNSIINLRMKNKIESTKSLSNDSLNRN